MGIDRETAIEGNRNMGMVARKDVDVIVVDDEEELAADIQFFLKRRKLKVATAGDPHTALKRVMGHDQPFILLSDVMMPGMDGLELVQVLNDELGESRDFAVILFSGFANVDRAISALRLGVLDFLVKPFDLDHLWLAVQRGYDQIETSILGRQRRDIDQLAETLAHAKNVAAQLETAVDRSKGGEERTGTESWSETFLQTDEWFIRTIKWHQSLRRLRDRIFPSCACDDGGWEIVLYILEQHLLNRAAPVTSACHATSIPQTTANRKVDELVKGGLLVKHADRVDRRRVLLSPTSECIQQAEIYFRRTAQEVEAMLLSDGGNR